ncbi:electron transport complex subunit RsxG [Magnetospirillum sp. UT-4]|uniref:electron transport complex subunit RsxG n=1 Tax=Magnetospirillum sp. UT-4 TaxID=2681467 RepID=UPI00137C64A7|nr:electron transport complex subunit RsxG [Magnetospirillum sp. UT-4]CAA7626403.1 putative oxidoreductase [Magnetospirillum sp. UT-4]
MSRHIAIHGVILGGVCLAFGALMTGVHMVTAEPIALRAIEAKQASLAQVIPAALHDNDPSTDHLTLARADGKAVTVYRATKAGSVTGLAYEVSGSGYAGEIRLMMGVDAEGRLLGVSTLSHKETPGLGDKIEAKKNPWITRFAGLSLGEPPVEKWKVKKDGGQFDQFSGATITPRAVVGAIRGGLEFFADNKSKLLEAR